MKKLLLAVAILVAAVSMTSLSAPVSAAAPYCGITWGSLPKADGPDYSANVLTNIRTGRHDCFDRMVFDLNGRSAAGYNVQYVNNVYADPSGALVPLAGGAKLQIVLKAASYNTQGHPTYPGVVGQKLPNVNLTGYDTFREAKFAGSFEGYTTVGLGVRAKLPYRVFKLDNRVVVDVAHRW